MRDGQIARRDPTRQTQAAAEDLHEVVRASKDEDRALDMDREGDPEASAEIFFEPRRAGETLDGANPLRGATGARRKAGPDLPPGWVMFRDRHSAGRGGLGVERERSADDARRLSEPPSQPACPERRDLADVNGNETVGDALREAPAGRRRQAGPDLFGQELTKTNLVARGSPRPGRPRHGHARAER